MWEVSSHEYPLQGLDQRGAQWGIDEVYISVGKCSRGKDFKRCRCLHAKDQR